MKRKLLIYLLTIMMAMPTWLVTGIMNATHVKAAETLIFNEGFEDGVETLGWSFQEDVTTYESSQYSGDDIPALKFNKDGWAVTPIVSNPTKLSFWARGTGDEVTSILVVKGYDGEEWDTIGRLAPISSTADTYEMLVNPDITKVKFDFTKNRGNLALDDVKIWSDDDGDDDDEEDITPPVIEGVEDGGIYNEDLVITFNEGNGTITKDDEDPQEFNSGDSTTGDGHYSLTVEDEAGNSTTVEFTIELAGDDDDEEDITPPVIEGVEDGGIYNEDLVITFNEGNGTITKDDEDPQEFNSGDSTTGDGHYSLTVEDEAGNSTTVEFTIELAGDDDDEEDITLEMPVINPIDSPVNSDKQIISGTAVPLSTVIVSDSEENLVAFQDVDETGVFSVEVALVQNAENIFYVTAKNAGGETSAAVRIIIVEDSNAPIVTIKTDPNKESAQKYLITIDYTDDSINNLYSINNGEWVSYVNPFTVQIEGAYTIKAIGIDRAGNFHESKVTINVDLTAGIPQVYAGVENKTINLTWTDNASDTVFYQVFVAGNLVGNNIKEKKYAFNVLEYGSYAIRVIAVDNAGNQSKELDGINKITANVIAPVIEPPQEISGPPAPVAVATDIIAPSRAQAQAVAGPEPAPAPQTTETTDDDENGIIKGTDTQEDKDEDKVNWTPWIVLFVLILLAGAITGGYFYWFNGEEEVTTVVSEPKKDKKATPPEKAVKQTKKPNKKSKRW